MGRHHRTRAVGRRADRLMKKKRKYSIYRNVTKIRDRYWICRMSFEGVQRYLGCYPTQVLAYQRIKEEKESYERNPSRS